MAPHFLRQKYSLQMRCPRSTETSPNPPLQKWGWGDLRISLLTRSPFVSGFLFFLLSLALTIGFGLTSAALAGPRLPDQGGNRVIKIVDGDTLSIEYKGRAENIRLIGIDTPESRINKKARKDAARNSEDVAAVTKMGKEATRFVKTLVKPGDPIAIEFDRQPRDKYGRLLGYVYLSDGKMLNEEIVKAGYASLMTYPPNVKYQDRFLRAYREARENNRGLWNSH